MTFRLWRCLKFYAPRLLHFKRGLRTCRDAQKNLSKDTVTLILEGGGGSGGKKKLRVGVRGVGMNQEPPGLIYDRSNDICFLRDFLVYELYINSLKNV